MDKINLDEMQPKTIAALNDQEVKLVKVQGEFPWHHHEHEDEFFMVWRGRFRVEFRDHVDIESLECAATRNVSSVGWTTSCGLSNAASATKNSGPHISGSRLKRPNRHDARPPLLLNRNARRRGVNRVSVMPTRLVSVRLETCALR